MELLVLVWRQYRWPFISVMALSLASAALGIGLIAFINQRLIETADTSLLVLPEFLGLLLLLMAVTLGSQLALTTLGHHFVYRLRSEFIKRILDTHVERIEQLGSASLLAGLTSDVRNITIAFVRLPELVQGIILTIGSAAYLWMLSGKMLLVTAIWMAVTIWGGFVLVARVYKHMATLRETEDKLYTDFQTVLEGRDPQQKVAATRTEIGTDVNYGEITRQLIASLQKKSNFSLQLSSEVRALKRNDDNSWTVTVADLKNGTAQNIRAKFVFIGAGGAALKLLQESGIPEAKDYAGFPVGGQFLVSENPDVVNHHLAKVYGKASVGAPPMSVPHIDTRVLDGKRVVLFGPFATFSTKFLKNGSLWDLMSSTTTSNVMPMIHVGLDNFDLVKYLVSQVMLSEEDRFEALKEYYPQAKKEDWRLWQAGQRVQIIKRDADKGGVLRLGTEVVSDQQGTIAALLGASPGASTAAPIMLNLLEKVFGDRVSSPQWQATLKAIVPSYGRKLNGDVAATERELQYTSEVLGLKYDKPQAVDSTPKPQLKPQPVQKEVADIAL